MPDQLDSNQSFDDRTEEIKATIKSLFQDLEIDELEIPSIYLENNFLSTYNINFYCSVVLISILVGLIPAYRGYKKSLNSGI